jgi:hypothetical protein
MIHFFKNCGYFVSMCCKFATNVVKIQQKYQPETKSVSFLQQKFNDF